MKILAVADIHGSEEHLAKLGKLVKKHEPEFIIFAGDLSNFGKDLDKLAKKLDFGVPVLMIHGNHESAEDIVGLSKKFNFITPLHGGVFEKDGVKILGCGGGGLSRRHEDFERMKGFFRREIEDHEGKLILVTHAVPRRTKIDEASFGNYIGDDGIKEFMQEHKPDLLICGHIHETSGMSQQIGKTLVINPGPQGSIIDIEM